MVTKNMSAENGTIHGINGVLLTSSSQLGGLERECSGQAREDVRGLHASYMLTNAGRPAGKRRRRTR